MSRMRIVRLSGVIFASIVSRSARLWDSVLWYASLHIRRITSCSGAAKAGSSPVTARSTGNGCPLRNSSSSSLSVLPPAGSRSSAVRRQIAVPSAIRRRNSPGSLPRSIMHIREIVFSAVIACPSLSWIARAMRTCSPTSFSASACRTYSSSSALACACSRTSLVSSSLFLRRSSVSRSFSVMSARYTTYPATAPPSLTGDTARLNTFPPQAYRSRGCVLQSGI